MSKSFGQSVEIDSLKSMLADKSMSDSMRVEVLLQLGWDMNFFDPAKGRRYIEECIALARKQKSNIQIGSGYSYMGSSFFFEDSFDSALHYYKIAETYYLKDTTVAGEENLIVNRMSMGTVALQQNLYEEALGHYFRVIDYFENGDSEDWANLLTAYANVGLVYNDMKQFDKALEYHSLALNVIEKHPVDAKKKVQVQMLVALDLLNLKKYDDFQSLMDSSEGLVNDLQSDYLKAKFYALKGRYLNDIEHPAASIDVSKKALKHARTGNMEFEEANILFQLGRSYFGLGQYPQSLQYLLPALSIHRKLKDKTREKTAVYYIAQAYYKEKNYKEAASYFDAHARLTDSLHQSEIQKKINEIENKFQNKQKADSILVLQKNSELQQLALRKKENQNIFLTIGAALLLISALLFYRNQRNKHRLLKQSELLHEQQIAQMEKERRLVAAQSLMKGQEEERSRLAKDLHDGVGGLLSGVKLSLSTMKGNVFLSEENAQAVAVVIHQLDASINELRRVSHNMMPEALIRFGLKEALENYCENINKSGELSVRLQTYGLEKRMAQGAEISLYRIVQELLNNVIKHAEASNVLVQLTREGQGFSLTVEDDGKGFDPDATNVREHAGIANIRSRAQMLDGDMDMRTAPGEGTSVTIIGICKDAD